MSLVDRLAKLDSSVMSDVLDEAGFPNQVLSSCFRPLDSSKRMCGIALCARGRPIVRTRTPAPPSLSGYAMETSMSPGKILVVDAGPESVGATVGGFVAATLKAKGAHGLVVNGAVRDAPEIAELGLPTFFRFSSPVNAARRWELVDMEVPLALPGIDGTAVIVNPGDYLLGDVDGVVVVPSSLAKELIEAGERLQEIEQTIRNEISKGATREEAFARNPRFDHIRRPVHKA